MALIRVTMLSRDKETNGRELLVKHDTISAMSPGEMRSDDVVIIGSTKDIPGTMLWFTNGNKQFVSQTVDEIRDQINIAIKLENTRYHVQETAGAA
jgi:hypothetical protein